MNARRGAVEYRMIASVDARDVLKPARLLAMAEGYALVRRPGAATRPFVVEERDWLDAPARAGGSI